MTSKKKLVAGINPLPYKETLSHCDVGSCTVIHVFYVSLAESSYAV